MGGFRRWFRRDLRAARDVDAAMRRALRRVLEHDLEGAESELASVVAADSLQTEAFLALARLYRSRGEIGRAIRVHQNLLLRKDLSAEHRFEALQGLAGDFQRGGFLQRAIAAYEEVLEQQPRDPGALRALVRLHADARDHARAIELQRRLSRLEGGDAKQAESRLLFELAQTAQAEGRTEDARKALKRALRLDGQNVDAWILLGTLEAELGSSKRALAAWRRVPDLDPRRGPEIYPRLESSHAANGRPRDFESYLRARLKRSPGDASARLALASVLAARGASAEGIGVAREVLEEEPDDLVAHRTLARLLLADGREQEALKAYEDLLEALDRRGLFSARERIE